jgi:PAS domain S-box-containing protein
VGPAVLVISAGYFIACNLGFNLRFPSQALAAIWAANAMLAAALILLPSRVWWVLLLAIFPAHIASYEPHGTPVWDMVWLYLYGWVMAVSVAGGLRAFFGDRFRFEGLRQMTVFLVLVTAVPGAVELAGASIVLSTWTGGDLWTAWRLSYLGNLLAFLTIFPAVVLVCRNGREFLRRARWNRYAEFGVLAIALFAVAAAAFSRQGPQVPALFYAPLPFLLWAAVRFGPGGLSLSLLVVVVLSVASAIGGRGPFLAHSASENVLSLQIFLIAISVPLMILAALIEERGNREQLLRLARERYEMATSGGGVGVWEWDIETGSLYLDPALKSALGYDGDKPFDQNGGWSSVFHPDDLARAMEQVQACADGKIPRFEQELRVLRKDGSIGWLLDRGKAVRDRQGQVIRLTGTKVDITERKRAAEALNESEERNQAMLRAMPDLMFLMTKDGVYLDYHAKDPSQLYFTPDGFIGKNIRDVLSPDVAEVFHRSVKTAMMSREPATHEYSLTMSDGSKGHFEWRLVDCGDDRVLSIVRDITERRRAEEALRDSEERYRTIFELTEVGAAEVTTDGAFIRVNDAFCEFTGYSRDELLGLGFGDITCPEDLQQCLQNLQRMLSGETEQIKVEKRYMRKDGEIVWAEVNAAVVRDAAGRPQYIVSLINDITDRKRVEQLLREEFRVLTESMPQVVWASRPDGKADYYNRRYYELTGAADGADDGRWQALVHPDDRDNCVSLWNQSVLTGRPYQVEGRLKDSDTGEYRWHLARALPVRDEKGKIVRWVGTSTDIHYQKQAEQELREVSEELEHRVSRRTAELSKANETLRKEAAEREQAEEALRESERQFRAIFDNAAIAIALVSPDGRPVESNPALVEMLGYSSEELRRMTFAEFTHPSDVDLDLRLYRRLMDGEIESYRIEKRYYRKDGRIVWANLTVSLVRNGLGQPRFAIGMAEDITERKWAEANLLETQAELAHISRLTALGELTASIAHEVNQPLAAIVGNADICLSWLNSKGADLGMVREALADIIDDGNRAGQVIARVRSLIKKDEAQKELLDINAVIREAIALVASEAVRRQVSLKAELSPHIPPVLGDRIQLQQVLLNLIMNGFESMAACEGGPRELIIKSGECDSAFISVEIRDSGPGIDPADLERVFAAFYTTKSNGIGIGLSICRSIINAHGGKLWAARDPRRGAIFEFKLPACVEVYHG